VSNNDWEIVLQRGPQGPIIYREPTDKLAEKRATQIAKRHSCHLTISRSERKIFIHASEFYIKKETFDER
jgi:hypothetical protein